jgi:hypothetical protein
MLPHREHVSIPGGGVAILASSAVVSRASARVSCRKDPTSWVSTGQLARPARASARASAQISQRARRGYPQRFLPQSRALARGELGEENQQGLPPNAREFRTSEARKLAVQARRGKSQHQRACASIGLKGSGSLAPASSRPQSHGRVAPSEARPGELGSELKASQWVFPKRPRSPRTRELGARQNQARSR